MNFIKIWHTISFFCQSIIFFILEIQGGAIKLFEMIFKNNP